MPTLFQTIGALCSCICIHLHICIYNMHVYIPTYLQACMHAFVRIYIYKYICIYTHIHILCILYIYAHMLLPNCTCISSHRPTPTGAAIPAIPLQIWESLKMRDTKRVRLLSKGHPRNEPHLNRSSRMIISTQSLLYINPKPFKEKPYTPQMAQLIETATYLDLPHIRILSLPCSYSPTKMDPKLIETAKSGSTLNLPYINPPKRNPKPL